MGRANYKKHGVELTGVSPEDTERVLDAICAGAQTQTAISHCTKLDLDSVGLALVELFNNKLIVTEGTAETRVYRPRPPLAKRSHV